jgi:hypothetical protein
MASTRQHLSGVVFPEKTAALETDFAANGGALVDLYDGSCGLE